MRDDITRLLLASAIRLPMPAPQGCIAVAVRHKSENWDGAARTSPFTDEVSPTPRMLLYSLTKTFIATAILKLVEQKRAQLDAPLATYLPSAPFAEQITLRQILRHSSGLPDYGALPQYHAAVLSSPDRPWREEEFIARTCGAGLAYAPDKGWLYSNIGYLVLKQVIAAICQEPFARTLKTLIFDPAGLSSLTVPNSVADLNTLLPGHSTYLTAGKTSIDVRGRYHPGWVAHGVIAGTASDVADFYHALLTGKILDAASLREMKQTVKVPGEHPPIRDPGYGLGLMADTGAMYGHTGGGPGYHSAAYFFEAANATVAVLANAEIDAQKLAMELGALLQARV